MLVIHILYPIYFGLNSVLHYYTTQKYVRYVVNERWI